MRHHLLNRLLRRGFRVFANERQKPTSQNYYAKIQSAQSGNDLISEALLSSKPFFAARIGSSELEVLENFGELSQLRKLNAFEIHFQIWRGADPFWRQQVKENIQCNSGFFTASDKMLERFSMEFIYHLTQVDLIGVWYRYVNIAVNSFCKDARMRDLMKLDPYYHKTPWSSLEDEKPPLFQNVKNGCYW